MALAGGNSKFVCNGQIEGTIEPIGEADGDGGHDPPEVSNPFKHCLANLFYDQKCDLIVE